MATPTAAPEADEKALEMVVRLGPAEPQAKGNRGNGRYCHSSSDGYDGHRGHANGGAYGDGSSTPQRTAVRAPTSLS